MTHGAHPASRLSTLIQRPALPEFARALGTVTALSRDELIGIAVARGCHHYSPFVAKELVADRRDVPHDLLGCALLCGPPNLDTFLAIRVAAMVLSDPGCSPDLVARAAEAMGVSSRVAHIARVALTVNDSPAYWHGLLAQLPPHGPTAEADFLPKVSRFSLESGKPGPGLGPIRVWLRTHYMP